MFVSVRGLSLVAASGGHSSSRCAGLSLSRPFLLRSTGSRRAGSAIVAHGPSCSVACGLFSDQGSNPCPLHWQADSQPLRHQGSPPCWFSVTKYNASISLEFKFSQTISVNLFLVSQWSNEWNDSSYKLCWVLITAGLVVDWNNQTICQSWQALLTQVTLDPLQSVPCWPKACSWAWNVYFGCPSMNVWNITHVSSHPRNANLYSWRKCNCLPEFYTELS